MSMIYCSTWWRVKRWIYKMVHIPLAAVEHATSPSSVDEFLSIPKPERVGILVTVDLFTDICERIQKLERSDNA